jgi:hypothetical protein
MSLEMGGGCAAGGVRVRCRRSDGEFSETTLDRVSAGDVVDGLPVREFRSYKGRPHYSGWYWCATGQRLVAYESRLELAATPSAGAAPRTRVSLCTPRALLPAPARRRRARTPL